MPLEIVFVVAVVFFSTLIRSTFGFGDALVAMPLLTMLLGLKTATPLAAMVSSTIALAILISQWKRVDFSSAWRLIVSTLAGIPLGLLFLKGIYETPMKLVLACVIVGFASMRLFRPNLGTIGERSAYAVGFLAGILGGAYNTNGPLVVIYGGMRGWDSDRFRATLQGYFFPTGLLILAGHGAAGLWTREVAGWYLRCLPGVFLAFILGAWLHARIPAGRFVKLVDLFLLALGLALFIQTLIAG